MILTLIDQHRKVSGNELLLTKLPEAFSEKQKLIKIGHMLAKFKKQGEIELGEKKGSSDISIDTIRKKRGNDTISLPRTNNPKNNPNHLLFNIPRLLFRQQCLYSVFLFPDRDYLAKKSALAPYCPSWANL